MSLGDRLRARFAPPPPQVRAVVDASPDDDERVLAVAVLADGGWLAATSRGLREVPAEDAGADALPWHEIGRATWQAVGEGGGTLTVVPLTEVEPGVQAWLPPTRYELTDVGQLPAVLRRRVDQTVVASQRHPLPSGGSVLVAARRVPGQAAREWTVVFDDDGTRADPAARTAAREKLAAMVDADDPSR